MLQRRRMLENLPPLRVQKADTRLQQQHPVE
jgi:hypothetical protein